ncbi:MAG: class I SAM-dependent methyltransferase, partial [Elusimicrobiota bacterium]
MFETNYLYKSDKYFYIPKLKIFERIYIFLFGIPIIGLRSRIRYIMPILKKIIWEKALDIGCGEGAFAFYMARLNPKGHVDSM